MHDYDDYKLSNGLEREVIHTRCAECGGEIYVGEEYICLNNSDDLHEDCFMDYCEGVFNPKNKVAGDK